MSSEKVNQWRKELKAKIVKCMGGHCQICKYDRYVGSLELHHIDPNEKDFSFNKVKTTPGNWPKIANELKKCILLCANCHREIHANLISLPKEFYKFKDEHLDYKIALADEGRCCLECDTPITPVQRKFCSVNCRISYNSKNISDNYRKKLQRPKKKVIDWSDLEDLKYTQKLTNIQIGKLKGCSDVAVGKQLRLLHRAKKI